MPRKKSTRPPSSRASVQQQIETERRQLQRASAVLTCAIHAVERSVDVEVLGDAITAGRDLVDAAAAALEVQTTNTRRAP